MKSMLILAAVLLLFVAATTSRFLAHSVEVESAANTIAPVNIPSNLGQSDEAGPEVKLVLLALMPEGFDSSEIQLEPGEYLFIVGNRTGLKEVSLRLDREGDGRIALAAAGGRQRDWKKRLKLAPGTYVVTADDNPNWTCRITVR